MRLTLVTETFPPEVNGVARTLGRWVETFRARGHGVQVVHPRRPGEPAGAGRVLSVPLPFYREVRFGLVSPLRLSQFFRRTGSELVHIATEGPLGLAALVAARWLDLPVASSFHTNFDEYLAHYGFRLGFRLAQTYLRWFHNRTAVTLVPSEGTRQRLHQAGFERVAIWSRGVDASAFNPQYRDGRLRLELGLGPDDPLFVYVGRLAPEKNLPALLTAYQDLYQRLDAGARDRLRLALVGNGPLTSHVRSQRLPGLLLPGVKHDAELARWYASADIFAFPSRSETFGNVLLEAQASGLPVVGLACPALEARVTSGTDGWLVPSEDQLADALLRLCRDRAERRRQGQAARHKAEAQDWKPIFDDLEERYRALIQQRRR